MPAGQGKNIRRVTSVDVVRSKQGDSGSGAYTFEFTLDDGVEEYLLAVDQSEASTIARLIQNSGSMQFDKNTDDLIFENYGD
ncbi:hypothetical protein [Quadrisphaera sp. DSM 44207]|uniref:hypothetical protein n=1 Tax=Quadrisphaera sp. DSM 44207 TaxID=1881057 RepID=UPI0008926C48|nr:hypothetical protein [Quadrisphaera sp. DSM 44207]SDQ62907.1 hypothetical protein SAMN05428996_2151 [Quadrisphaera sp. DSM 44207]